MQMRHWKGFWPVWVRMWRVNSSDLENLLGQFSTRQAYGRSLGGTLHLLLWMGFTLFSFKMLAPAFAAPGFIELIGKNSAEMVVLIFSPFWGSNAEFSDTPGHFMFKLDAGYL